MRELNSKKGRGVAPVDQEDSSDGGSSVIRTHTPDAFEKRVWLELEHRVLAYHVVRMVVHSTNSQQSTFRSKGINATSILSLSFAALSPCKERRLFVTVLANLCLLIENKDSIKNHPSFTSIWSSRKDNPQVLYDAALSINLPKEEIVEKINTVFQFFRNGTRAGSLSLSEDVRNNSKQWWVIRARIFTIWLKDFVCNADLLKEICNLARRDLDPPHAVVDNHPDQNTD
eukprot:scaffold2950_cov80-Cylindrotheca_fusiformis.AAC.1